MSTPIDKSPTAGTEAEPLSTAALAGVEPRTRAADGPEARSFAPNDAPRPADEQVTTPLFSVDEAKGLRGQWDTIQASFVDEPRAAVREADTLTAATMKRLAETFAAERAELERQWDKGEDVSTEDLRQALQRYRSFFGRLLSI